MHPINLMVNDEAEGAVRVDRFPSAPNAVTTISIQTLHFEGKVTIEATIELEPDANDWFVVHEEVFPEFVGHDPQTIRNKAINVVGRFIWMRASRENTAKWHHGTVDRIAVI